MGMFTELKTYSMYIPPNVCHTLPLTEVHTCFPMIEPKFSPLEANLVI